MMTIHRPASPSPSPAPGAPRPFRRLAARWLGLALACAVPVAQAQSAAAEPAATSTGATPTTSPASTPAAAIGQGAYMLGSVYRGQYDIDVCWICADDAFSTARSTALMLGAGYRWGRTAIEGLVLDWGRADANNQPSFAGPLPDVRIHLRGLAVGPAWRGTWGQRLEGHLAVSLAYLQIDRTDFARHRQWRPMFRMGLGWRFDNQSSLELGYALMLPDDRQGDLFWVQGYGLTLRWPM